MNEPGNGKTSRIRLLTKIKPMPPGAETTLNLGGGKL